MGKVLVIYDTMTGNTEKFVKKLPKNFECCHISEYDGSSCFILVTYTINFGQVPETTQQFLDKYNEKMIGVSSGGNKNWGAYFGIAGNKISTKYGVPLINKFELQGTKEDIQKFIEGVDAKCQSGLS